VEARRDWSDTARANLVQSIAKHFGQDPRFVVTERPVEETDAIRQEFERVRSAIEANPARTAPERGTCLAGPAPELANATGTDAILLVYATEQITPPGQLALFTPLFIVALPIMILLAWVMEPAARASQVRGLGGDLVALCLVEPRKGATVWFHTEELGFKSLLDSSDVERLIQHAYDRFRES
jgi:hypothetical protein